MSESKRGKTSVLDPREGKKKLRYFLLTFNTLFNFSDYKIKSVHQISSIFFIVGLFYIISTIWITKNIIEAEPELKDQDVGTLINF